MSADLARLVLLLLLAGCSPKPDPLCAVLKPIDATLQDTWQTRAAAQKYGVQWHRWCEETFGR